MPCQPPSLAKDVEMCVSNRPRTWLGGGQALGLLRHPKPRMGLLLGLFLKGAMGPCGRSGGPKFRRGIQITSPCFSFWALFSGSPEHESLNKTKNRQKHQVDRRTMLFDAGFCFTTFAFRPGKSAHRTNAYVFQNCGLPHFRTLFSKTYDTVVRKTKGARVREWLLKGKKGFPSTS